MLSHTCKAALKAVVYLCAEIPENNKAGIVEIAAYIKESEHTIGKLLQKLVKERIINSTKGPHGGFFISEKQKQQSILKIIEAIDGKGIFDNCGMGLSKCSNNHSCPIHNDYKPIREMLKKMYRQKTIKDLSTPITEGMAFLIG